MLIHRCGLRPGQTVLVWGAAGGLGVFAIQICRLTGARCVGVVSEKRKGGLVERLGATAWIDRREFDGMLRRGDETPEQERQRFAESRRFAGRVKEILGEAPDIVFEHVGEATFPTSVYTVRRFGKVVICGATSGYRLDFDARYLWMHQKEIVGSHIANAWQSHEANQLVEQGEIRPVLWKALPFEDTAKAHQLMYEGRHFGKIAVLVGAERTGLGRGADGPGAIWAQVGDWGWRSP